MSPPRAIGLDIDKDDTNDLFEQQRRCIEVMGARINRGRAPSPQTPAKRQGMRRTRRFPTTGRLEWSL